MAKDDTNGEFEVFDLTKVLSQNDKINMVVDQNLFKEILQESGTKVDSEGFLADEATGIREKSNSEDEIKFESLGVLSAGSKVFIEKNIASFSEFLVSRNRK